MASAPLYNAAGDPAGDSELVDSIFGQALRQDRHPYGAAIRRRRAYYAVIERPIKRCQTNVP